MGCKEGGAPARDGVSASTTSRNVILDAGGDPFAHLRRDLAQRLGAERRAARDGREALRGAGERREAWERRAARKEARERARLAREGATCDFWLIRADKIRDGSLARLARLQDLIRHTFNTPEVVDDFSCFSGLVHGLVNFLDGS